MQYFSSLPKEYRDLINNLPYDEKVNIELLEHEDDLSIKFLWHKTRQGLGFWQAVKTCNHIDYLPKIKE